MTLKHASLFGVMLALACVCPTTRAATPTVTTILGTGVPGYSDTQVNNPYGIIFGPDGAVYFCDLDNQRIRRLDLKTNVATTTRETLGARPSVNPADSRDESPTPVLPISARCKSHRYNSSR